MNRMQEDRVTEIVKVRSFISVLSNCAVVSQSCLLSSMTHDMLQLYSEERIISVVTAAVHF